MRSQHSFAANWKASSKNQKASSENRKVSSIASSKERWLCTYLSLQKTVQLRLRLRVSSVLSMVYVGDSSFLYLLLPPHSYVNIHILRRCSEKVMVLAFFNVALVSRTYTSQHFQF